MGQAAKNSTQAVPLPYVAHSMDTCDRVKGARGLLSKVFLTVQRPPAPRFQTSAWDREGDCVR